MNILTLKENRDIDGNLLGYVANNSISLNMNSVVAREWIENGGVIEPFETAEEITAREIAEANALIFQELEDLDKASIGDIREWVASQTNAPQALKDIETAAVLARGKLK